MAPTPSTACGGGDRLTETYDWNQRHTRKQQPPTNGYTPTPQSNGNATPYGKAALTRELEQLLNTTEGSRNHQLNTAAYSLGQLVAAGHLNETDVRDQLTAAAFTIGLDASEIPGTIRSGIRAGAKQPRNVQPLPPIPTNVEEVPAVDLGGVDTDFWDRLEVLQHIREFARARMCSAWSLLGVVLLRALAVTPAHVVLPPLIGGYGSLNMFVALVGPSGVGKGATEAAAVDAIDFYTDIYTAPVGSGEGIAHQYAHRERGGITRDRDSVLFTVPEVDTLTALGQRQGSTLLSQLRSAFSGERLGFGYADATRRIPIERHTYRLGLTLGVQPEKAGPLILDSDGGTPQRFIWLPATDPTITSEPPPTPSQWVIEPQRWTPGGDMFHVLSVPTTVAKMIREAHARRARGEGEALDGHALFAREKIAQAICILDRRRTMIESDWDLSGIVMHVSDITRAHVTDTINRLVHKADTARAHREASRVLIVSETVSEAAVKRVAGRVARLLVDAEMSWSDARRRVAQRDREHFEEAVERLISAGQVEVSGDESNRHLRGVQGVQRTPPSAKNREN
jgi:hypothetical protein